MCSSSITHPLLTSFSLVCHLLYIKRCPYFMAHLLDGLLGGVRAVEGTCGRHLYFLDGRMSVSLTLRLLGWLSERTKTHRDATGPRHR